MEEQLFLLLTYFLIYSVLGWVMESIFRSIAEKKIINTGFLRGPICPIYGFGAIIMITLLSGLSNNIVLLFIVSVVILTFWEYIVGVLLEKIFHTKYWDYSDHKINFQGRICLSNSIYWGILGVAFVKIIHPFIQELVGKININILYFVVAIASLVFAVDVITSIVKVLNIQKALEKVEELNNEIKEKLNEIKTMAKETTEKNAQKLDITENIQKIVEDLNKKRNKIILRLYKNVFRLKKAFPAIDTKEIREILNKKIELKDIIKNKKNKKLFLGHAQKTAARKKENKENKKK